VPAAIAAAASGLAVLATSGATATETPLPRPHPERVEVAAGPMPRPHPERREPDPIANILGAAAALLGGGGDGEPADESEESGLFADLTSPDLLLTSAYRRFEAGDYASAARIARSMPGPAGSLLIEWLIATEGGNDATWQRLGEAQAAVADWPGQRLMQIRYEQALRRAEPDAETVLLAMEGREPVLEPTVLLLARALVETGRDNEAASLIRGYWREEPFSEEMETAILEEFGSFLTGGDHSWRMARILYDGGTDAAVRTAALLGEDVQAFAAAWSAVNRGSSAAASLLDAVPTSLRSDPGYQYARLRQMVRTGRYGEAATLLAGAPSDPSVLIDPEAWSSQRRTVARALMERGETETAYEVVAEHSAVDRGELVEAEFMAGWIALSFLDDGALALPHFETLASSSSLPLSQSRAYYWIGRSHEALGAQAEAEAAFGTAAELHTTYYGQLALLQLGVTQLPIAEITEIDEAARSAFTAIPMVQAVGWLTAFGREGDVALIARHLGDTLQSATSIGLLTEFAEAEGNHQLALQVAKLAANRGLAVDRAAFSDAVLRDSDETEWSDRALVYAVARQESAFNIEAESSAGAIGLLQILPSTARETANRIGVAYSETRLRTDAEYNAIIGAAYMRSLIERYSGHYGLALAAFNAGLGRVDGWLTEYGDPRATGVDAIDWIERIPFDETRNYVQRVLENYQVYRAILGGADISLARDLAL